MCYYHSNSQNSDGTFIHTTNNVDTRIHIVDCQFNCTVVFDGCLNKKSCYKQCISFSVACFTSSDVNKLISTLT